MSAYLTALRCGVALCVLQATATFAQTSAVKAPGASATGGPDIVVTAQRREERAQDVPVVVTAFSAERLEQMNVSQPQDLYGNVPSLVAGTQGQEVVAFFERHNPAVEQITGAHSLATKVVNQEHPAVSF